jgi:hypothetical protein
MSTRRHKPQQKKYFAWPILVFGAILLVLAAFLLVTNTSRTHSASAGANVTGSPKVAVDPQKIDYGYVKFGNNESFRIKVTNTGGGTLRIQEQPYIEVLEGC